MLPVSPLPKDVFTVRAVIDVTTEDEEPMVLLVLDDHVHPIGDVPSTMMLVEELQDACERLESCRQPHGGVPHAENRD